MFLKSLKFLTAGTLIAGLLSLMVFMIVSSFSYVDLSNRCYIRLQQELVRGDRKSLEKAILLIREQSFTDYEMVCRNVDRIIESYCISSDPHISSTLVGYNEPGCFIKGSKAIYIRPEDNGLTQEVIEKRAQIIKKYANISKDYWDNYKNL